MSIYIYLMFFFFFFYNRILADSFIQIDNFLKKGIKYTYSCKWLNQDLNITLYKYFFYTCISQFQFNLTLSFLLFIFFFSFCFMRLITKKSIGTKQSKTRIRLIVVISKSVCQFAFFPIFEEIIFFHSFKMSTVKMLNIRHNYELFAVICKCINNLKLY